MPDYTPPVSISVDLGRLPQLIRAGATREIAHEPYVGAKRIFQLAGGQVVSESRLMCDTDGSRWSQQDGFGQTATSLKVRYRTGPQRILSRSLDAAVVPYVAFCRHLALKCGFSLGDLCAVIHRDRICFAVYGDASGHALAHDAKGRLIKTGRGGYEVDQDHYTFGEASVAVHEALGHPVVYQGRRDKQPRFHDVGIDGGVLSVIFPRSGSGVRYELPASIQARGLQLWRDLCGGAATPRDRAAISAPAMKRIAGQAGV